MLRRGLDKTGLPDVWRDVHQFEKDYTFHSAPHAVVSRINYIFMFQNDGHKIRSFICIVEQRKQSNRSHSIKKYFRTNP